MAGVDEIREGDDETLQSSLITVVVVDLPTYLDKRGSLDGRHPAHHSFKKLRQDPDNSLASPPHQVNDEVADEERPRLVRGLQL